MISGFQMSFQGSVSIPFSTCNLEKKIYNSYKLQFPSTLFYVYMLKDAINHNWLKL